MLESRVRVALIDAGSMATNYHYPSLTSFPDVELTAICDLVPEKAQRAAERFGIPRVYSDYRQMLAEVEPRAVYAIMPPQYLYEPALEVLKQGRHLFVEKPFALTTHQARMLTYAAAEHQCLTMVGFQRRFVPAMTALRRRGEERRPIGFVEGDFLEAAELPPPPGSLQGGLDPP